MIYVKPSVGLVLNTLLIFLAPKRNFVMLKLPWAGTPKVLGQLAALKL